ncbi:DUF349 domain-containing protein [Cellulomonas sp. KRMCY2]|uniref:DUF349 domain-containing protein n=1 Tax=Cellulomonas sp. KRMCY2 TaxID=1304865 RepID=UPI00045EB8BC|nr:DUF349 domain-containing protein [Cellulomonas sp. KRMCY2]
MTDHEPTADEPTTTEATADLTPIEVTGAGEASSEGTVEGVADEEAPDEEAPDEEPVADEVVAPDEEPVADEVVAPDEEPVADEVVVPDEEPTPDEVVVPDEEPTPDELTTVDAPAAASTTSESDQTVEDVPTPEVSPTLEGSPAAQAHAAETPAPEAAPSAETTPTARPMARPVPRPHAPSTRPAVPSPAAVAATAGPTTTPVPVPPALTPAESAEAARWGRVDDDGTVWVREESGERVVGQYPGADHSDALAFYVRRYADLHAKVLLFEARLSATDLPVKEIDSTLEHLTEELAEPAVVGDLDALRTRLVALGEVAAQRRAVADAERAAAKQAALEARTAIVEAAEKIAGTDPERIQWRPAGEQLHALLDQWKDAQRHGPRVDRGSEDALWKRFSHARSTFDRERRRYFSELEKHNAGAKAEKAALVATAEQLATSTDWAETSSAYRDLMTRWKNAGRASRKDDDALWARFRAAQDQFFSARDANQKETDAEFAANLEVKLALLAEAEKLVPVRDLAAARAGLRDLQERWEKAGKVPRGEIQRVEGRLRAVEQAVREAEQSQWQRSNPETRARAEGAAAQLLAAIAGLEQDLAKATAAGNTRKIAEAQAALDARRAWLEQVERAAADSRG